MLIPLSDPIWTRLYGPYGVEDVPHVLARLGQGWDDDVASNLFWEMLFHQESLYPVTYAALPWLWQMIGRREPVPQDALFFLSIVLICARRGTETEAGPKSRYPSLSLKAGDHAHSWLPQDRRLRADYMPVLAQLEAWLVVHEQQIAETCLNAVPDDSDHLAAVFGAGYCSVCGSEAAGTLLQLWGDGQDLELMDEVVTLAAPDVAVLTLVMARVRLKNPRLAAFIESYAGIEPPHIGTPFLPFE